MTGHAFIWDGPEMYCGRCLQPAAEAVLKPCNAVDLAEAAQPPVVEPEPKIAKGDSL